ncbi:hypothetical protein B0H13DRAFT_2411569 [Mycena leptocephala]|nr:hypothetical protein B0H13DRAFT_2411569 [Mycena leptocephala]
MSSAEANINIGGSSLNRGGIEATPSKFNQDLLKIGEITDSGRAPPKSTTKQPEPPIRRRRDTDQSEIADDERDAGVPSETPTSTTGLWQEMDTSADRRERETSKRRDPLMMIIFSPGRIAIARKGQDAGENGTFLNHERADVLRRRRLRSRRVRISRITQHLVSTSRRKEDELWLADHHRDQIPPQSDPDSITCKTPTSRLASPDARLQYCHLNIFISPATQIYQDPCVFLFGILARLAGTRYHAYPTHTRS